MILLWWYLPLFVQVRAESRKGFLHICSLSFGPTPSDKVREETEADEQHSDLRLPIVFSIGARRVYG